MKIHICPLMSGINIPSLLLWEYTTSETSGLTMTAPMGIYAEERACETYAER